MKYSLPLIFKYLSFFCFSFFLIDKLPAQETLNYEIAPDFIAQDLNGNEVHLYDLLDQGKTVVLDFSATWCAPCWSYALTGILEDFDQTFGANGTGEAEVFFIEGDAVTNMVDLEGTGTNTLGDWISTITYPIIDNSQIADDFMVSGYPTLMVVYPNRLMVRHSVLSAVNLELAIQTENYNNLIPQESNNVGFLDLTSIPLICESGPLSFRFQNLGSETLESLSLQISIDGALALEETWTGELPQYSFTEWTIDYFELDASASITFTLLSPNGIIDENALDNNATEFISTPIVDANNNFFLNLYTDLHPQETAIQIKNEIGEVVFTQQNFSALDTLSIPINPIEQGWAGNGCFTLLIIDDFGDGLADGGLASFEVNGETVYEISDFGFELEIPFEVSTLSFNANDAAVAELTPNVPVSSCGGLGNLFVSLINEGQVNLMNANLELSINQTIIDTINWTGNLNQGSNTLVQFANIDWSLFNGEIIVEIRLLENDANLENNYISSTVLNGSENYLNFELHTDKWPDETHWQVTDETGTIYYTDLDYGPLDCETQYQEVFWLPDGCYELKISDDAGDGLITGPVSPISHECTNGVVDTSNAMIAISLSDGSLLFDNPSFGSQKIIAFGIRSVEPETVLIEDTITEGNYQAEVESDPYATIEWFLAGNSIGTGHILSYQFPENGSYDLEVVSSFPNGLTNTLTIPVEVNNITSIATIENTKPFDFTYDGKQIRIEGRNLEGIKIYNINGQTLFKDQGKESYQVDAKEWPMGWYAVQLLINGELFVETLMNIEY